MQALRGSPFAPSQSLDVLDGRGPREVPVISAEVVNDGEQAFAIAYCQSGAALDLTKGLEIWTFVQWIDLQDKGSNLSNEFINDWLRIVPGKGVGTYREGGEACLSAFAKELLIVNLRSLVPQGYGLRLEIVFPRGRELAAYTSNAAFGVVNGLALIGTQAEVQDSASPNQLQETIKRLGEKISKTDYEGKLIFVIGENGLQLASAMGLNADWILKVGNWLGPLLVAAAEAETKELLLFGYHGKLIKLAGGVFHTHHHLADARLEILTTLAVKEELPFSLISMISVSESIEEAFQCLKDKNPDYARQLWKRLAFEVEQKSLEYLGRYGSWSIKIGSALFDRQRNLRWVGPNGIKQLSSFGVDWEDF